jgi:hypothetical protein
MGRALNFLLFWVYGALPLWATVIAVAIGGRNATSEYWTGAPWEIVVAIPACLVTFAVAVATASVFRQTHGQMNRKFRVAGATFLGCNALLAGAAMAVNHHQRNSEQALDVERARVVDFVKHNDLVTRAAGGSPSVDVALVSMRKGTPVRYEVSVHGLNSLFAIVDVERGLSGVRLKLKCTTRIYFGQRRSDQDPCSQ